MCISTNYEQKQAIGMIFGPQMNFQGKNTIKLIIRLVDHQRFRIDYLNNNDNKKIYLYKKKIHND